ncbi:hypothetical protein K435DRAFT_695603 [Dendrothele bispora CBS 962.96]|uniref:Glycoside hydrolase family 32 protein n=1 Tax=Dendrothele bispora (strain CBS 962.96) TaxID=1314807 RepID=A0A4S8KXA9_DENBC|nr:hypothetical protein K435DRAFT_695603 [Dendrothele bispora CBS 962.96]
MRISAIVGVLFGIGQYSLFSFLGTTRAQIIPGDYTGPLRPQVHFSPPQFFMNDPNGCFLDSNGTWHLYYQYNPTDITPGNQHWGHATSKDLYHWENQPIAIFPPDNTSQVFTGSAVIDVNNTSGFFPDQDNGIVAIYTLNTPTKEIQAISFSRDGGFTFTAFDGNPIIDSTTMSFRDPKVIQFQGSWVMVVAFSADLVVAIYTSPDLKTWTHASNFTHADIGELFECPNLVEIPIDGSDETKFILSISTNPGPNKGTTMKYLVGDFNGTHFIPDPTDNVVRVVDAIKDSYAGQYFYGLPDNEAVFIAWATNGDYASDLPTASEGWRSSQTLPRRNSLTNVSGQGWDLVSSPFDLSPVTGPALANATEVVNNSMSIDYSDVSSNALYFEADITGLTSTASGGLLNFTFSSPTSGESLSGVYQLSNNTFNLDRNNTRGFDNTAFEDPSSFDVSVSPDADGNLSVAAVIDRSIIEVFLNGGKLSGTALFYPTEPLRIFSVSTEAMPPDAKVTVGVWALNSVWV